MREIFTREENGEVSTIEVDFEAIEFKKESPWLLSVFVKFDVSNATSQAYEEFLETKESLIIALEYDEQAHYLGGRVLDGWNEFYFCAADSKELNQMVTSILKDTAYVFESNAIKDKKWNFFETQLFPSDLELAHIQSAKTISMLEEEGENLQIEREVEHYVSFHTPTQKTKFVDSLDIEGFSYKDDISSEEFEHGVALVKKHAVTEDVVKSVVEELYKKIKESQGFYEGWSTTLVATETGE